MLQNHYLTTRKLWRWPQIWPFLPVISNGQNRDTTVSPFWSIKVTVVFTKRVNFFSWIFINMYYEVWGLISKAQVIWSLLSTCTENHFFRDNMVAVGQFSVVKVPNFFGNIIIIISKVIHIFEIPKFAFYYPWLSRI